jgi:hypothetical protein
VFQGQSQNIDVAKSCLVLIVKTGVTDICTVFDLQPCMAVREVCQQGINRMHRTLRTKQFIFHRQLDFVLFLSFRIKCARKRTKLTIVVDFLEKIFCREIENL